MAGEHVGVGIAARRVYSLGRLSPDPAVAVLIALLDYLLSLPPSPLTTGDTLWPKAVKTEKTTHSSRSLPPTVANLNGSIIGPASVRQLASF
jgi:hypothetical protein